MWCVGRFVLYQRFHCTSLQEMQESMNMLQQPGSSLPSMEEFFTNMFGGGGPKAVKKPPSRAVKRRDKH